MISKSYLHEGNSLFNTILTICICALIVLILSIINYLLYRLFKHISTSKSIDALPQDITSDDKEIWINDRILNEMQHISRTDNAYKSSRIDRKRKSKMYNLILTKNVFSNIFI
jgi:hypothetical protein